MVGGNHHQILVSQLLQEGRQPPVKLRQGSGIAVDVPAVAIEHVEIHQVDEAKPVEVLFGIVHGVV